MANELTRNKQKIVMLQVIYEIKCPRGDSVLPNQGPDILTNLGIGIRRRLTQHRQNGALVELMKNVYNIKALIL